MLFSFWFYLTQLSNLLSYGFICAAWVKALITKNILSTYTIFCKTRFVLLVDSSIVVYVHNKHFVFFSLTYVLCCLFFYLCIFCLYIVFTYGYCIILIHYLCITVAHYLGVILIYYSCIIFMYYYLLFMRCIYLSFICCTHSPIIYYTHSLLIFQLYNLDSLWFSLFFNIY